MWRTGLLETMNDPKSIISSNDKVLVIRDKYPKAEVHFLVLPKAEISSLKSVDKSHIELLRTMHLMGREASREHGAGRTFRFGYHAVPSMSRLHLHVISDDFNSPCLKTKKHWNSFTTAFFLESLSVISTVESLGRVPHVSNCDLLLKTALKCHKCDITPSTMPKLKTHLLTHLERE